MEKFKDLKYVRPDFKKLKKELNNCIKEIETSDSYEKFKETYLKFEEAVVDFTTMSSIAEVRNTCDKTDKFYEKEVQAISVGGASLMNLLKKLSKTLLNSKYKNDLEKEYGSLMIKDLEVSLKLSNPKIIFDVIKENKLCQKYSKAVALCNVDFRGEKCNFYGLLKHMESVDRNERKEAFEAWANLYESVSKSLDDTYDKLIKIRNDEAKKLKIPSYIDYIYLSRKRYDYNKDDVAKFRDLVVKEIVPFANELYVEQASRLGLDKLHFYDESLTFKEGNASPIGNKDELVKKAQQMYHQISNETGEFFDFMVNNELFDLDTRPGKHLGGYCTFFPSYKAPFIFSNFNGTSADVDVLTHEAGHAFQGYISSRTLPLISQCEASMEVCEIHSMSMEHFAYPYMESFFGENADKYRFSHLTNALLTIPYLVAVDEFQHVVFENPKATAMDRRKFWHEIEKKYLPWRDYEDNKFLNEGGFWMQKQHIFLYPFYYIDYALAQICAFQFFIKNQEDSANAWKDYLTLCKAGGSLGYFDLLKLANLKNPFADDTIPYVLEKVKKYIQEFKENL